MNRILIVIVAIFFLSCARAQTVDFTYQSANGTYCSPSTIQFTQNCTGGPVSFIWDFGNGQNGYAATQASVYNLPGSYTVKLTAIYSNNTIAVSKTIVINPPVKPVITVDRDYICTPGAISFTGSANDSIANYVWDFGDGTAGVNTASANTNHTFSNYGTYTVRLRATGVSGCYGDTSIVISVKALSIVATVKQSLGCAPANVIFTGDVTLPLSSSVSSYLWDFGDGSPTAITMANTTTHIYPAEGAYSPQLTVTASDGCTKTYYFGAAVILGTPPATTIAYVKQTTICGSDYAILVAKATNANRYFWVFGDGTSLSTTDTIVAHKYRTLGIKSIGVAAYNNKYCAGSTNFLNVKVIGVIANYSLSNTCTDKNIYSFQNTSLGNVTSSMWNFGDGGQLANNNNPSHPYPSSGQFSSSLIVNDNTTGCADTSTNVVYTAVPVLFSKSNFVCKNDSVTFSIINNYTDTAATYTWNVLGKQFDTDSLASITVKADSAGTYNNLVIINRGPQFCPDTVRAANAFAVKGPVLNFASPANICFGDSIVIINNSKPFITTDTVRYWYWSYGIPVQRDSSYVYQPSPFQYPNPGTYNISLTAIDKNGCLDSLSKNIQVYPSPFLIIKPQADTICAGQPVTLVALSNGTVAWSPVNSISCVNCDTTVAMPTQSVKYYATVTNAFNCAVRDSNHIQVYTPFLASPSPGYASVCSNETATLNVIPKGKKVLWSPATTLSDSTIYNPVANPLQTTVYTATLTDSAGCFSSNTKVEVYVNPLPVADAGPDRFYTAGTNFTFNPTYSSNVNTYSWTPSALLSCSNCAMPSGVASYTQTYILQLVSDSGCVATDSITISTDCKTSDLHMPKAFTPNNDGLNDFYYPLTKGFNNITSFTIFNRQGKMVYLARNFAPNDKSFGWDGRVNGEDQPVGSYVYTLEAICDIGKKVFIRGSFLLVR